MEANEKEEKRGREGLSQESPFNRKFIRQYMEYYFDYTPTIYQLDFTIKCFTNSEVAGVFCRQTGKSETTSKIAVMMARRLAGGDVLVFAPTDKQVGLMSKKIANTIKNMRPIAGFQLIDSKKREFEFENGSRIICSTVGDKGDAIRGYTASCIIMDEAAFIKDSIVNDVILPMGSTTNAPVIKISTPFGDNHFYETYRRGLANEEGVAIQHVTWRAGVDANLLKEEYVEKQRKRLSEKAFQREYEAQFVEDDTKFFARKVIEACVKDYDIENYEPDEAEDSIYYCGVDVAGGEGGSDQTVIIIVKYLEESQSAKVVKMYRFRATQDVIYSELCKLDDWFGFEKIYIDKTTIGAGLTHMLSAEFNPYKKPLKADQFDTNFEQHVKVVGITFTNKSKLDIFSYLRYLMEQKRLTLPRHPQLLYELGDFRSEKNYDTGNVKLHHSEGGTDDFCDALALAVRGLAVDEW